MLQSGIKKYVNTPTTLEAMTQHLSPSFQMNMDVKRLQPYFATISRYHYTGYKHSKPTKQ